MVKTALKRVSRTDHSPLEIGVEIFRGRLAALAVASELMLRLRDDDQDRDLTGLALCIDGTNTDIAPYKQTYPANTAVIPMPRSCRIRHLLSALMIDDGDVVLAVLLLTTRLAEARATGKRLSMFANEQIGHPAVALHLAVRAAVAADNA
jgi:hypothetical protein